eukprot:132699_1
MMSFATCIACTIILITISLGHDSSEDDDDINNCQFGQNIQTFQRSFDILKTSDCSCNNYQVQYKLNQIAMQYIYITGILSANRHDAALRECATKQFTSFVQNFFDENVFYETSLGQSGGLTWNSLNEFLFDGNKDASSFTDLVLNSDTTTIMNTNPGIITDCTVNKKTETVTLNILLTSYRRPDDATKTDVIQRSVATFEFTSSKNNDYKYLITTIIFKGTRFSINNAPRTGTDTRFTTFECEN